jgi:hypothetical protein
MMRIDCPRPSSIAAAAILTCLFATAASAQTQIHPPGGGGATNPVVIAVLADGYTNAEQDEFNADAANFFLSGLLQDSYFKGKAGFMRITTVFELPVPPATSKYGFRMGVMDGACQVAFPTDTIPIQTAAASLGADYVVVIGNYPYTVACTLGKVAYVSAGASGVKVLEHEFGHMLASLWDEFGLPSSGSTPFPHLIPAGDKRNCARRPPNPHWGTAGLDGCGLYNAAIVRPTNMCRMGASHHPDFCDVCSRYLNSWFNALPGGAGAIASHERTPQVGFVRAAFPLSPGQTPGQKPPATQPILRLLLRFNPERGTAELRRGFNSTGVYVPSHQRVGKYAYEILDDKNLVDFGILSDQLFQTRGHAGGVGLHGAAPAASTEVIVQIPGETIERLRQPTTNVSMVIWELLPDFPGGDINRGTFMKFRSDRFMKQTQVISAAEIRRVLVEPPKQ